jgi:tetratricopeptide (TPR) repeat protein
MKKIKKYSIIATAILTVITAGLVFFSSSIKVSAVPFGLPAKTKIPIGEKAKFPQIPAAAEVDLQRANDLRMAGAFAAAQDYYETILLKYPNLSIALFGAAYSIIAQDSVSVEKIANTKSLIESLAQQLPGSVWVKLLLTFSREHEGNISYALDMAAELASASPAFSEARLRYAELLLKTEQPTKAANEARAAISISGGLDARAYANLAFALHKMGNVEECSELVNYALPRFPSQTGLLLLHGYLSEYSRDFDDALNDYRKILVLKPGDINALNAIATLGEKISPKANAAASYQGNTSLKDQARETAKIILPIIEEYPENLPLREALGKIYLKARLMREARAQFSEIYAQDFEYPSIKKLMEESSEEQYKFISLSPALYNKALTDSLAKTFATLRKSERMDHDYLGRYLAHYGSTLKEFFSKYSITRFKKIDDKTFTEKYNIESFIYENTIFFDSKKAFYAVRSVIVDSMETGSFNYIQDLFGHFLKKETQTLGEGAAVESRECYGDKWSGAVWTSRDNFEVLMNGTRKPRTIFIVRLQAKRFLDTGNLCSYVAMALDKSRMIR